MQTVPAERFNPEITDASPLSHHRAAEGLMGRMAMLYAEVNLDHIIRADALSVYSTTIASREPFPGQEHEAEWAASDARRVQGYGNKKKEALAGELMSVRKNLANLSDEDTAILNDTFEKAQDGDSGSPFLDDIYSHWAESVHIAQDTDNTGRPAFVEWLADAADNAQLLNFIQWHNHRFERLAFDPEVMDQIFDLKDRYTEKLQEGVDEGYLSPNVAKHIIPYAGHASLYLTDYYDATQNDGAAGYANGFWVANSPMRSDYGAFIVEPTGNKTLATVIEYAGFHEMNHQVLGSLGPVWLNEALTEHIAEAMRDGDWDLLNPQYRAEQGAYDYYRELLDTVLTTPRKSIPLKLLTQDYSENPTGGWPTSLGEETTAAFVAAYKTPHVIDAIDQRLKALESKFEKKGILNKFDRQQQAAEIVTQGWAYRRYRQKLLKEFEPKKTTS